MFGISWLKWLIAESLEPFADAQRNGALKTCQLFVLATFHWRWRERTKSEGYRSANRPRSYLSSHEPVKLHTCFVSPNCITHTHRLSAQKMSVKMLEKRIVQNSSSSSKLSSSFSPELNIKRLTKSRISVLTESRCFHICSSGQHFQTQWLDIERFHLCQVSARRNVIYRLHIQFITAEINQLAGKTIHPIKPANLFGNNYSLTGRSAHKNSLPSPDVTSEVILEIMQAVIYLASFNHISE